MGPTPLPPPTESTTIKVVSHSPLIYWWPVWVAGFVLAILTYAQGDRLAIVPEGTRIRLGPDGPQGGSSVLELKGKPTAFLRAAAAAPSDKDAFPTRVADDKAYGLVFTLVLLLVILSTNISLRGLWSVLVVLVLVMLAVVFAAEGWWTSIVAGLGSLHIFLSAAGYLVIAAVLFVFWVLVVFVYDQRRYMIFSPGQFVVHQEVGDLRQIHDTTNVNVEKRRSDLFRNWILGFGSGDLIVQTPGTQGQQYVLPNVLFAARRVREIANLLKTRPVVPE